MNKYYIRCIASNWPTLLGLGVKLGAITVDEDDRVSATNGGAWDYIGEIALPTGALDAEDMPILATVKDTQGNAYLHANLITPISLGEVAAGLASTDAEVAQGLSTLALYFLLDAQGNARAPTGAPYRVFAGMGV